MKNARKTVLLTGASGVVGRALIDELSQDHEIVGLRHRKPVADARVRELTGSLDNDTLGLSTRAYDRLAARVDLVIHAAASTSWKASPESIRETNIGGTANVLRLAEHAEVPMFYISTAFVANPALAGNGRFPSSQAYIESKIDSEQLTRDSVAPTVIVRPSVVIGDSRDGHMSAFQGLHRVCGLIARGHVPLIACDANALTDTVPQDVVAAGIAALIRERVTEGEFWLTAGPSAMTASDLVATALRLGHDIGANPTGPRFIPAEAVDRLLLPLMEDVIQPSLRQMFAELLEMTWLFQLPAALPTSLPDLGFGAAMTRDRLREAFDMSMRYWAQEKGLLPGSDLDEASELAS